MRQLDMLEKHRNTELRAPEGSPEVLVDAKQYARIARAKDGSILSVPFTGDAGPIDGPVYVLRENRRAIVSMVLVATRPDAILIRPAEYAECERFARASAAKRKAEAPR